MEALASEDFPADPCTSDTSPDRWIVDQRWKDFTQQEHATWAGLYERQAARVSEALLPAFAQGMEAITLPSNQIPDFKLLSERLRRLTGWTVVAVPGLIPEADFFALLSQKKFPAGNFIRRKEQFDYIEEPDVFHDVFGHVPLLANPSFAAVMQRMGVLGVKADRSGALQAITRLYWFTVEFGLADEGGLKAYGAGIASSPAELDYALNSPIPRRESFDLQRIIRTAYRYDAMQPLYFVVPNLDWLLKELEAFDLGE